MAKATARKPLSVSVLKNNGRGYAVNQSGNTKAVTVYLPDELGFRRGERVFLYPIEFEGMRGVFISTELKE